MLQGLGIRLDFHSGSEDNRDQGWCCQWADTADVGHAGRHQAGSLGTPAHYHGCLQLV